nr:replication protein A 70 kDa DNA-binding subunit B [Tanacetum cinerariifolium]
MATFTAGFIKNLSAVKDNITLRVRILRTWMQTLYNKQHIKNMELILMDEHDNKLQAYVKMALVNKFKHQLEKLRKMGNLVVACNDLDNYDKNGKAWKKKPLTLTDVEISRYLSTFIPLTFVVLLKDMDVEEDPEEDLEEDIPRAVASPPGSPPISPSPLSESSSDSDSTTPVTTDSTFWVSPLSSTFEVGGPSSGMETRQFEIAITRTGVDRIQRRMDAFDVDIGFVEHATTRLEDDVLAPQAHVKTAKAKQLQTEQDSVSDKEEFQRIEREIFNMHIWVSGLLSEAIGRGAVEARPSESIDVLAVYGDARPARSQVPPDGSQ